jgi:aminobenzoyl-glutamate transport protein
MAEPVARDQPANGGGLLGLIERLGNRLPDPIFLFIYATACVLVLSHAAAFLGWSVQPQRPQVGPDGALVLVDDGAPLLARSLLTADGAYWLIANLVRNFLNFPPLGVVLVSMLGIGVAERVGLFGAFLKWMAALVPARLLTPTTVFLGIMSNVASDAGYIILPPLAAGLYAAFGRSPLAGIAAAFAGISGGFSANLVLASTDTLVAPLTERGAQVLAATYSVLPTCNWYFLIGSTFLLTLLGWAVTAWIVEPRLTAAHGAADAAEHGSARTLSPDERRGLRWAAVALAAALAVVAAALTIPGSPLVGPMPAPAPRHGPIPAAPPPAQAAFSPADPGAPLPAAGTVRLNPGLAVEAEMTGAPGNAAIRGTAKLTQPADAPARMERAPAPQPRWSQAIVPMILFCFLVPGLAFGAATGAIKGHRDVAKAFVHAMASMAPIIAIAFFAAQFIECLAFSQLDRMLAFAGGAALASMGLPQGVLIVGLVVLVMIVNMLMSSMSAKWSAMAVIVVPMMMMSGVSPELTQAAYRVGDSVTNIVTPLNAYLIVVLAAAQRYRPQMGLGNLIAMIVPYTAAFAVGWPLFLLAWVYAGVPLGPGAPLWYAP